MITAEALLAGPRGRRMCWQLLASRLSTAEQPGGEHWPVVFRAAHNGDLTGCLADLEACVERAGPAALTAGPDVSLAGPAWAVTFARYHQQPDGADQALAAEAVIQALRPVAGAVAAAPGTGWWMSPLATERQWYVQFLGEYPFSEPQLSRVADRVTDWRADEVAWEDEEILRQLDEPDEPLGSWTGHWWSVPTRTANLTETTRALPGWGPVRLSVVHDRMGWTSARCWPLRPRPGVRVYEIDGPRAWAALVARYPLDVSRSRRHDWWATTGWTGRWLIPDYEAVSRDYDAVHLPVLGYLTTAGIAMPVDSGASGGSRAEARTVLAGWDPDETWWLTDALTSDGAPEMWGTDHEGVPPFRWHGV